jgi:hypothetical protein
MEITGCLRRQAVGNSAPRRPAHIPFAPDSRHCQTSAQVRSVLPTNLPAIGLAQRIEQLFRRDQVCGVAGSMTLRKLNAWAVISFYGLMRSMLCTIVRFANTGRSTNCDPLVVLLIHVADRTMSISPRSRTRRQPSSTTSAVASGARGVRRSASIWADGVRPAVENTEWSAMDARRAAIGLLSPPPQGDFESRHDRCDRDGTHDGRHPGDSGP